MRHHPRAAGLALVAVLATGCAEAVSSMTQHWFYGYVVSQSAHELCLADARTEDLDAERCFALGEDSAVPRMAEGDLVKVRYARTGDAGHGGGHAISVRIVRSVDRSDG